MSEQVNQRTTGDDSGRVMSALDQGTSLVGAPDGRPVGEFVAPRRHRSVSASTVVEMFRAAPRVDRERFQLDPDEVVDQDTDPRG